MQRLLRNVQAQMLRHEQAARRRIREAMHREACDLTERQRQRREGDREQRRLMREEARTAWAAFQWRQRRTRHEP